MKRERLQVHKDIPNFRELIWEEIIYNEETDEPLYELIQKELVDADIEKCYKSFKLVFKRTSDNKHFLCYYDYSYNWDDEYATAEEVFPVEKHITIIEWT